MKYVLQLIKSLPSLVMALVALGWVSCHSLLDQSPYNEIDNEHAIENIGDAQTALVGVYGEMMKSYWGGDAIILGDVLTDNCFPTINYNGYTRLQSYTFTSADSEIKALWFGLYQSINSANNIINVIDGLNGTVSQKNDIKGQALALRGIAYLELTKWFSPAFSVDSAGLGVPIVLEQNTEARPLRASLQDTYQQIESDLLQAEKLLTNKNQVGDEQVKYISLWSVKSYLARFYLYRTNYAKAVQYATDVIASKKFSIISNEELLKSMLRDDRGSEIIFQVGYTKVNSGKALNTAYYSIIATKKPKVNYVPALDLINLYKQFGTANSSKFGGEDIRFREGTFFSKQSTVMNWEGLACFKYPGNPALAENANMPKVIRLPELYLIRAEAYSAMNKDAEALADYNTLRKARIENYLNETDLKGQRLKDEIFNERKRELCFEGFYWFDLKRTARGFAKMPLPAELAYLDPASSSLTVPANSYRWLLPIPAEEINGNPNIQKNPGY